jgi:hypothetical protein
MLKRFIRCGALITDLFRSCRNQQHHFAWDNFQTITLSWKVVICSTQKSYHECHFYKSYAISYRTWLVSWMLEGMDGTCDMNPPEPERCVRAVLGVEGRAWIRSVGDRFRRLPFLIHHWRISSDLHLHLGRLQLQIIIQSNGSRTTQRIRKKNGGTHLLL